LVVSRRALLALSAVGLAVVTTEALLATVLRAHPLPADLIVRHLGVGVAWIAAGLAVGWRRLDSRLGLLITAVGVVWLLRAVDWWTGDLQFTFVIWVWDLYAALIVYVVLAFPGGRLTNRLDRNVVVGTLIAVAVIANITELFSDPREGCGDCPRNLTLVYPSDSLADATDLFADAIGAIIAGVILVLLVRRWRDASAAGRRVLAPVLWISVVAAAVFVATNLLRDPDSNTALNWAFALAFGAIPLGFLAGLLRTQLHRGALTDLVLELGAAPPPARVRESLARALGDPSLDVAYWVPADSRWVGGDGRPTELPATTGARAVTVLEQDQRPVAALAYDPAALEDPTLVRAAGAAVRLALENARLQAQLRAQLAEVQASRERILAAGDAERRRLERDLHDGAQQSLLGVRVALRLARGSLTGTEGEAEELINEADTEAQEALKQLRTLARGIHPAILTEQGLAPALASLGRRSPLAVGICAVPEGRLPERVETAAYFIVAEALANAAKHARASHVVVSVRCTDGRALVEVVDDGIGGAALAPEGGLAGLRDRVDSLDGSMKLESHAGRGTALHVEIPCA
jgi:signal transduction histidine kinase